MGTPEIAATCLRTLIENGQNVVGAVTREDKPKGRGKVLTAPPVKELAMEHGIPVYQPKTLRDGTFDETLKEIDPDLILVVAYGRILPPSVLDYPKYGCINVHVSLLPKFRGAAPMQRAVMSGDKETGITIMYMDEGLDTGDIICQEAFPIGPEDDFETVHDRSAELGAKMLLDTVLAIGRGETLPRTKQDDTKATFAPKIEKEECHIDFTRPASVLDCTIRGITPIPMAYCYLNGAMLKIVKAVPVKGNGTPGTVLSCDGIGQGSFTVSCGEDALKVTVVIPEGKGRMTAGDFIRGRKIKEGDILN